MDLSPLARASFPSLPSPCLRAQVYAERLLAIIDPDGRLIDHKLYRDSCLNVEGNYLKDLNVLGRDLTRAVLVDNSPHAFGYQLDNGIPIESWFDDRTDTELLKLIKFLETIQVRARWSRGVAKMCGACPCFLLEHALRSP